MEYAYVLAGVAEQAQLRMTQEARSSAHSRHL